MKVSGSNIEMLISEGNRAGHGCSTGMNGLHWRNNAIHQDCVMGQRDWNGLDRTYIQEMEVSRHAMRRVLTMS